MNLNLRSVPTQASAAQGTDAPNHTPGQERVLLVKVKNVYGNATVYPANENAEFFAAIAGTKTLSTIVLAYARRLGFDIKQVEAYDLAGVEA